MYWNNNGWLLGIIVLTVSAISVLYCFDDLVAYPAAPSIYADGVVTDVEVLSIYGYPDKIDLVAPRCSTAYVERWTYYGVSEENVYWEEVVWVFVDGRMKTKEGTGWQIDNKKAVEAP